MKSHTAIHWLRTKMGKNQTEFAALVGVTATSISRYENGHEPNSETFAKLAEVANHAGAPNLREFFTTQRCRGITKMIKHLGSPGAALRISRRDLQLWQNLFTKICALLDERPLYSPRQARAEAQKGIDLLTVYLGGVTDTKTTQKEADTCKPQ